MALINVDYKPTSDPNYLGALKEPSRNDFNGGGKYETLFQGLSQGLTNTVSGVQETIKSFIKDDVNYGVDKLRDAQGVGLDVQTVKDGGTASMSTGNSSTFGGQPGDGSPAVSGDVSPMAGNRPPNQEQVAGDYARVKAAYDQGKISDRNYYAQLEVMNRSLRSRYPGFRDEVDQMVQSITGVVPANALRKAVLNDLQTAQSTSDALTKERQKMLMSNPEYFPADAMQREAAGKPYTMAELYAFKQPKVIAQEQVKDLKAQLELKAASGNATSTDALQAATGVLGHIQNQVMADVSNNQTISGFMKKITDYQAQGKVLQPEEQQQMLSQFQQMKFGTRAALERAMNEPLTPGSKETFATRINDRTKINQLIDAQMQPFEMIEKGLTDNNLGLINLAANSTKAMTNADTKALYERSGYWRAVAAIGSTPGGQEALKALMVRPESGLEAKGIQATLDAFKIWNIAGPNNPHGQAPSWEDQFKELQKAPGGTKASTVKQYVADRVNELTNPALSPELRANAAKIAFSPGNIDFLNKFSAKDGSQSKIFNQLVSPAVTKSMMVLRDSSPEGKQIWDSYSKWSMNNFMGTFKQAADGVNSTPDRPWINVNWNPNSKQFEVTPTPEGIKANSGLPGSAGTNLINLIEGRLNSGTVSAVERMNQGIKAMQPILEANGFKPEDEIKKLVNFNGLKDKNNGFWANIVKVMNGPNVVKGEMDDLFGGSPVNFTQPPGGKSGRLSTEKDPFANILKDTFSNSESGNNYNRLVNDGAGRYSTAPLTNMTIGQVLDFQSGMKAAGYPSSAAGKFQIIKGTLQSLVDEGVVSLKDKYSPENQEKLAEALLERRGLSKFQAGQMSHAEFMKNLGNEWEAIKRFPDVQRKVFEALKGERS